jgi:hypothetical protein
VQEPRTPGWHVQARTSERREVELEILRHVDLDVRGHARADGHVQVVADDELGRGHAELLAVADDIRVGGQQILELRGDRARRALVVVLRRREQDDGQEEHDAEDDVRRVLRVLDAVSDEREHGGDDEQEEQRVRVLQEVLEPLRPVRRRRQLILAVRLEPLLRLRARPAHMRPLASQSLSNMISDAIYLMHASIRPSSSLPGDNREQRRAAASSEQHCDSLDMPRCASSTKSPHPPREMRTRSSAGALSYLHAHHSTDRRRSAAARRMPGSLVRTSSFVRPFVL